MKTRKSFREKQLAKAEKLVQIWQKIPPKNSSLQRFTSLFKMIKSLPAKASSKSSA